MDTDEEAFVSRPDTARNATSRRDRRREEKMTGERNGGRADSPGAGEMRALVATAYKVSLERYRALYEKLSS